MNDLIFMRIMGLVGMFVGGYWVAKREIGYGVRGREPLGYITGLPAVIVGVAMMAFSGWLLFDPAESAALLLRHH